ncbi:MAG: hypothetical protein H6636_00460 [Anaerolineales bacterium]|nr:hypothetical protein [Anaerolineales bacterium]
MSQSLILFSSLAGGLFEETHPPMDAMTINFGLTPFGVIVVVLLIILLAWVAMNVQAGRADLHAAAEHGEHHADGGHDAHGH